MKKPDQVKYNEETGRYDAALTPYATSVGAPRIEMDDIEGWKTQQVVVANSMLEAQFDAIKQQYLALKERVESNERIYRAHFKFTPIVGKTYHLYESAQGGEFLSLLLPSECNFVHLGSYKLTDYQIWEPV